MIYANAVAIVSFGQEVHVKFLCNSPKLENVNLAQDKINIENIKIDTEEVSHIVLSLDAANKLRDGLTENMEQHKINLLGAKKVNQDEPR